MTRTGESRVEELFERAIDLPEEERATFLDRECRGDETLREEIEELLRCDDAAPDSFLVPKRSIGATYLEPGAVVGSYEIVRPLGEGGMGTVYEARQASPNRRVALKVIRPGRLSAQALRRFRQEAEVLGSLQHPGIAQVYEAGTATLQIGDETAELPFLAMELVDGEPIVEYAEKKGLSDRARLELVARLADTVHHAHQRGVIHRDLKPENVLVVGAESTTVALSESTRDVAIVGQPKILDFGIARVIGSDRLTLETRLGQIVGTLATMSPEQMSGDSQEVDVRTDVYALGVILYELLAGRPPIDLSGCTLPEAAQRIADQEPVPLGSLKSSLRGDVAVIAGKALHKEKERRYQSAAELAADLRRHLSGQPIEARADSALYVLGKTLRRHRTLFAAVTVVFALALSFAIVFGVQAKRLERELAVSNIERGRLFGQDGNGLGEELIWREFLKDPDNPHAYWALWDFYSHNPCVISRRVSDAFTFAATVSPDGSWIAVGDATGTIRLLDATATNEIGRLRGPDVSVRSLSPAPDGKRLAATFVDGTTCVWEIESSIPLWSASGLEFASEQKHGVAFHPDGRILAATGLGGTVEVFDAMSGAPVRTLLPGARPRSAALIAFSPDGRLLAASNGTTIHLWHLPSFEPRKPLETRGGGEGGPSALVFGPEARTLYVGARDKTLVAWDLDEGRPGPMLRPGNGWIRKLSTSADGAHLFASGLYRTDRWRLPELTLESSIPFFNSSTLGIGVFPEGDRVVTADSGGVLRMWESGARGGVLRFPAPVEPSCTALSPDGSLLAAGDGAGGLRVWDVATGELRTTLHGHENRIRTLQFHPHRPLLVSASRLDEVVRIWDLESGECVRVHSGTWGVDHAFALSCDGSMLASACGGGTFRVWSIHDGEELVELSPGYESLSISFSPDGETLATVSRERTPERLFHHVNLWKLDGEHVTTLRPPGRTYWTTTFSPDGSKLAAATWQWTILIWDLASQRLETELAGHEGTVWSLGFLPGDSDRLFSSGADGTVRLWSLSQERTVLTLTPFDDLAVYSVDTNADGTLLAAAGEGEEILLWDLSHFERHVAGNLALQLERLGPELGRSVPHDELLRWADEVLARPWPRLVSR